MLKIGATKRIAVACSAAVVSICALAAAVILTGDGDDDEFGVSPPEGGFPFATFEPAVDFVPAGDVHPIAYGDIVWVKDTAYAPSESELEPGELLSARGFETFDGDNANGIQLFFSLSDFREFRDVCGDQDYWKFVEYDGFSYEWLPGGTYRSGPQQLAVCPDGSVSTIFDSIEADWGSLEVRYYVGDRVLWHQAGDKYRGEIAGRPSVVVTYSGNEPKRTWIGLSVEYGVISVEARGLTTEEVLTVAEGIGCEYCGPP